MPCLYIISGSTIYCSGKEGGQKKMHDLYLRWLSVKGNWGAGTVTIQASQSQMKDSTELYEFITKASMDDLLGAELAADLVSRHRDAEAKLPADKKGQYIIKCLARLACRVLHHDKGVF